MQKLTLIRLIPLGVAALCLSGCVVFSTKDVNRPVNDQAIVYHLPKGLCRVQLFEELVSDNQGKPQTNYQFECGSAVVMEADPQHRYQLQYRPSALAEDAWTVKIGTDGLLTSIHVTTEDKSPQLVIKLAELAKEVAKGIALLSAERKEKEVFNSFFDPTDAADVARINASLASITGNQDYTISSPPAGAIACSLPANAGEGVLYRPIQPYSFMVKRKNISMPVTVMIPNRSELQVLPIRRAAFVKKVQNLGFERGILTEFTVNKPSEAVGFMEIPIVIAKTVVGIPGELLTVKVTQVNQQKNLLEAETALIEAEKARIEAEKALLDASKKR